MYLQFYEIWRNNSNKIIMSEQKIAVIGFDFNFVTALFRVIRGLKITFSFPVYTPNKTPAATP